MLKVPKFEGMRNQAATCFEKLTGNVKKIAHYHQNIVKRK